MGGELSSSEVTRRGVWCFAIFRSLESLAVVSLRIDTDTKVVPSYYSGRPRSGAHDQTLSCPHSAISGTQPWQQ